MSSITWKNRSYKGILQVKELSEYQLYAWVIKRDKDKSLKKRKKSKKKKVVWSRKVENKWDAGVDVLWEL